MAKIPGNYQYNALFHGNPVQRSWHRAKINLIEQVAPPIPGSRVLDAACGSGVISYFLHKMGATVLGVDINKDAIGFAKGQFGNDGLEFICQSIFDLKDTMFDFIYCLEAIEHFSEKDLVRLLIHLKGLIKPGGRLFVTTPNYASAWPLIEWCLDTLRLVPKLKDEQHLSKLTPKKLSALLKRCGWHLIEIGTFNGMAPFVSPISPRLSNILYRRELKNRKRLGRNLIYAIAEPREEQP